MKHLIELADHRGRPPERLDLLRHVRRVLVGNLPRGADDPSVVRIVLDKVLRV